MDQILIHEAEHNNLLKTLEKNLEIPQECTYANQKAIDTEVSAWNKILLQEMTSLINHYFSVIDSAECNN